MNEAEVYLDTSAVLPFYREEPLSDCVQHFLNELQPPVVISDLTKVEIASALARWVRTKEIDEEQARLLETTIADDIEAGLFVVRPVASRHYLVAEKFIAARTTPIRTLDALHLACCSLFSLRLVTCDHLMHRSAEYFGIQSLLLTPASR
ncbi:type II toxin-antitoxin system VapC family toxin [Desulfofustis limnaeus]|uniref:PIN domain-containing protein n=1 Tax=Desulfofustis limnaeus TaxID=2740163 RepID=A0ABN6M9S8_9BACT|nr:type II toxin-antitoxin system VapC family toxin [Desulfofustis limnaeus]BDD89125.1 hypothetical protein DPPLL_34900 [Desulfofustis limnaeus]